MREEKRQFRGEGISKGAWPDVPQTRPLRQQRWRYQPSLPTDDFGTGIWAVFMMNLESLARFLQWLIAAHERWKAALPESVRTSSNRRCNIGLELLTRASGRNSPSYNQNLQSEPSEQVQTDDVRHGLASATAV